MSVGEMFASVMGEYVFLKSVTGTPSIFKLTRKGAVLVRVLPTLFLLSVVQRT